MRGAMDGFGIRSPAGGAMDLDLRLESPLSPQMVTQILQKYGVELDGKLIDSEGLTALTVGKRIELLLRIVSASGGENLLLSLCCHACGETMELEIALNELLEMQLEAEQISSLTMEIDDREFHLRRPTGTDQLIWQTFPFADQREAYLAMLNSLIIADDGESEAHEINDQTLEEVSESLGSFDPLVNFEMQICCPYCQGSSNYALDLLEVAATQLQRKQMQLMQAVHRLAQRYHWSETEILAMPDWRRKRYLRLIDQEIVS